MQAQSALALPVPIVLVLDEDGTAVETESFFRTLEEGTALMALSKGQTWTAPKVRGPLRGAGGWFVLSVPHCRWDWKGGGHRVTAVPLFLRHVATR